MARLLKNLCSRVSVSITPYLSPPRARVSCASHQPGSSQAIGAPSGSRSRPPRKLSHGPSSITSRSKSPRSFLFERCSAGGGALVSIADGMMSTRLSRLAWSCCRW